MIAEWQRDWCRKPAASSRATDVRQRRRRLWRHSFQRGFNRILLVHIAYCFPAHLLTRQTTLMVVFECVHLGDGKYWTASGAQCPLICFHIISATPCAETDIEHVCIRPWCMKARSHRGTSAGVSFPFPRVNFQHHRRQPPIHPNWGLRQPASPQLAPPLLHPPPTPPPLPTRRSPWTLMWHRHLPHAAVCCSEWLGSPAIATTR